MKEEILVEQLKQGKKEAFDTLYEKYKNMAFHTAYLITGNRTDISSLEQVMQLEERKEVYAAIRKLPVKQRTVVILFYYNQCSVSEIAGLLGCMEGTVKSRLHTARKNMKKAGYDDSIYQRGSTEYFLIHL